MKIKTSYLKQIIKEELRKALLSENSLIDDANLLISPNYIKQDMDSTRHLRFGEPDYYADKIIQALQGAGAYADGLDAAFELYTMITMDEGERHPAFPSDEKSRTEIMDFLDYAIGKLQ